MMRKRMASMKLTKSRHDQVVVVLILLRTAAFCATLTATVVMAVNKQTKSVVVATVGNAPITATLTAKFQDTPANVFFVITNGMATFHSLAMLGIEILGCKFQYFNGHGSFAIAFLDMLTVGLASAGASAATFVAELGKNGNSHAGWDKVCDKIQTFCAQARWALLASYIGIALLMLACGLSITAFHRAQPQTQNQVQIEAQHHQPQTY